MSASPPILQLLRLRDEVLAGTCLLAEAVQRELQLDPPSDRDEVAAVVTELNDPLADERKAAVLAELAVAAGTQLAKAGRVKLGCRLLTVGLRIAGSGDALHIHRGWAEWLGACDKLGKWGEILDRAEQVAGMAKATGDSDGYARALISHAGALTESGNPAQALLLLDQAEGVLRSTEPDGCRRGACHFRRGRALAAIGECDPALAALAAAAEVFARFGMVEQVRRVEQARAAVQTNPVLRTATVTATPSFSKELPSMSMTLDEARTLRDRSMEMLNSGRVGQGVSGLEDALPAIQREAPAHEWLATAGAFALGMHLTNRSEESLSAIALHIDQARGIEAEELVTHLMMTRCSILGEMGRAAEAISEAWEVMNRTTSESPVEMRMVRLMTLGSTLFQVGRLVEAVTAFHYAIGSLPDPAPDRLAGLLYAHLGQAYQRLGQPNQAWAALDRAESLMDSEGFPAVRAIIPLTRSRICRYSGQYDEARAFAEEAVRTLESGGRPYEQANALLNLGLVNQSCGYPDEAANHVRRALLLLGDRGGVQATLAQINLANLIAQTDPKKGAEQYACVNTQGVGGEALTHHHLGYGLALLRSNRVSEGLEQLRLSVVAHRLARREAAAGEQALEFLGSRGPLVEAAVDLVARFGDAELAFELGQNGKGALAQEFLGNETTLLELNSPELLAARRIMADHLLHLHNPSHVASTDVPDADTAAAFYLNQSQVAELAARGDMSNVQPPAVVESGRILDSVQGALQPGWAVLDLWEHEGDLRVFVITQNSFQVVEIDRYHEKVPTLARRLELLFDRLQDPRNPSAEWFSYGGDNVWDDLHEAVIAPLISTLTVADVRGLYIVPHGFWHGVPLHAAREWVTEDGWGKPRYLCDQFAVAYLPAAAALPHLPPPVRPASCLSVVNPDHGTRHQLPGTEREAEALFRLFPPGDRRFFARGSATPAAADWRAAGFVLFGCHGRGDPKNAGLSRLYLAGDCLLAHDVLYRSPPLPPGAAVVLSGCQTGVKDWRAVNEGLGLMTAFLLRGAGTVLATQWDVQDDIAAHVVEQYAAGLVGGKTPATAYQEAVRSARAGIAQTGSDDPIIWAVFQLYGRAV